MSERGSPKPLSELPARLYLCAECCREGDRFDTFMVQMWSTRDCERCGGGGPTIQIERDRLRFEDGE